MTGEPASMLQEREADDLATTLARMARDLLAQSTLQQTLDRIVDYAVQLVDGCTVAGIMVVGGRQVRTLAASDELACVSDRIQGELGEGPCFDAAHEKHEVYRIADLTTTVRRWPRYAPKARELGIGSMMGFLLFTEDDDLGALNIYSGTPGAFTEHSERVGWLVASHASVAFANARTGEQLHEAIATRQCIGQALGIVIERYKISEQQAFTVLRTASQNQNVRLREVARTITETGKIPGAC